MSVAKEIIRNESKKAESDPNYDNAMNDIRARILDEGYAEASRSNMGIPKRDCAKLSEAIQKLESKGWPATFIFGERAPRATRAHRRSAHGISLVRHGLTPRHPAPSHGIRTRFPLPPPPHPPSPSPSSVFDEAWMLLYRLGKMVMAPVTNNEISLDMLAWCVSPADGQAGFSPHRDRQPEDVPGSFRSDGMAKYTTCWVALSDATPDASCLYMIPKQFDPGYTQGDGETEDPLQAALPTKEAYQNIR